MYYIKCVTIFYDLPLRFHLNYKLCQKSFNIFFVDYLMFRYYEVYLRHILVCDCFVLEFAEVITVTN